MKAIISLAAFWIVIVGMSFCKGYISQKTEDKYLRNLDKYYPLTYSHVTCGIKGADTLTFMATSPLHLLDPFHKWYIDEVGMVKPWSKLSKKLDSIAATYIETENKLK